MLSTRFIALPLWAALLSAPLCAEPLKWNDGGSVYLKMVQQAARDNSPASDVTAIDGDEGKNGPFLEAAQRVDHSVSPAVHEAPTQPPIAKDTLNDRRHLAPPSARATMSQRDDENGNQRNALRLASRRLAEFGLPAASMYKVLTGLTIVVGVFLLFAWSLRRGGRRMGRGNLPEDVVSVLGRVPLASRQFAELLRVGNKLVLVSRTPEGARPLTEVTDPAEVDRLLGLCQQNNPHSTTKAFEQVFRQLSTEATPGRFFGGESLPTSLASPAGAYRTYQRDTTRA
jgi:flagellar biogenesis protein FliO